jgi:hypothetical protein
VTNRAYSAPAIALALTLAGTAGALAAGPVKGKTYEGSAPSSGITDEGHHHITLHAGGKITLRVAGNGGSVIVHFSSSLPVLYCHPQEALHVQKTKSARISSSGAFKASVSERFKAGPGAAGIEQVITGHFSGGKVSGTIHTKAGAFCSGVASFSARTH